MKHSVDGKLVMLAELRIRPERREAFLDYTVQNLALSRAAAGNIAFDILLDDLSPDLVVFYEAWDPAEAQQAYMT